MHTSSTLNMEFSNYSSQDSLQEDMIIKLQMDMHPYHSYGHDHIYNTEIIPPTDLLIQMYMKCLRYNGSFQKHGKIIGVCMSV